MRIPVIVKGLLAAAAVAAPMLANAESNYQNGSGALTATAHVDFQVVIPKFLFMRVGTGTGTAAGGYGTLATVDQIVFSPTLAQLGNGVAVAGTGGDLTNGAETAVVVGNNGDVTFSSTTAGALNNGAGGTISYGQITATASNTTSTLLAPPALADGATTTTTLTSVNKVVKQDAKWTYSYANQTVPAAGTYGGGGGGNTGNGRVTYTAAIP